MLHFSSGVKTVFLTSAVLFSLVGTTAYSQEIIIYDTDNSDLPDNTIRAITEAEDGAVWVGTDWGLARLQNNSWINYNSSNAGLPDNSIRSVALDGAGKIWVGTFLGGLAILENDTVGTVYNSLNSPLPDDQVRAIAFDTAGVWIGTTGGLVYKSDTVWQVYNMGNSILRSNNIASILIDSSHRVWVGTVNGGLLLIDDTTWTLYRNNNSALPDNTILDLALDADNNIWIASPAAGITAFDGSTWLNFNIVNSNSPTNSYNGIVIINDVKYMSSFTDGLAVYRGGTTWENYNTGNSGIPQDDLLCIEAGDSGCVWLGTLSSGLVKFCEEYVLVPVMSSGYAEIMVFPVPASSLLNVYFSSDVVVREASIYNLGGTKVFSEKSVHSNSFQIQLSEFPQGIYFLEIIFLEGKLIKKLMKQ